MHNSHVPAEVLQWAAWKITVRAESLHYLHAYHVNQMSIHTPLIAVFDPDTIGSSRSVILDPLSCTNVTSYALARQLLLFLVLGVSTAVFQAYYYRSVLSVRGSADRM